MNTTEKKSRAPKKAKWDRPVTKAFYEKLRLKAAYVVREVHEVPGYVDIIMDFIDRYMFYQQKPFYYTESMWIWSFFAAIQGDIDKAIERRKRAKERAAERKAARERAKAEAEAGAMKAAEPEIAKEDAADGKVSSEAIAENADEKAAEEGSMEIVRTEKADTEDVSDGGEEKKGAIRSKIERLCGGIFSFGAAKRNKRRCAALVLTGV